MKYNLNKLRSGGIRYIAADASGDIWGFETLPIRGERSWRRTDPFARRWKYLQEHTTWHEEHIPNITIRVRDDECFEAERRYWNLIGMVQSRGRLIIVPLSDVPFAVSWEDEPMDLVAAGYVPKHDMKKWGDPFEG